MGIIFFPKRVSYARYGNLPVGNLGDEENYTLYDVGLARMLKKNRAVSWAAQSLGQPDLGGSFIPSSEGTFRPPIPTGGVQSLNQDDIWGDDEEIVSPVVRRPGCFRSICVDMDLQDLAIAALTDIGSSSRLHEGNPSSPTSVLQLHSSEGDFTSLKVSEPLGDEMSTSTSLPILQALVAAWLRDAFSCNNEVADSLLHHVYRVVSAPETLMHDPALHRVVHSLMKATFSRLLGELQRLGCYIVYASFHKITVATNKTCISDAEEYINFVVNTIRGQLGGDGGNLSSLSRVALRPRQFHTHFLFLDEYNFGTMQLERFDKSAIDTEFYMDEDEANNTVVVPSVVTAWSIMNYLGSETAQEYFRILVGRFSRDILKKQVELKSEDSLTDVPSIFCSGLTDELVKYKKKMVVKHFASYLTRAVSEIIKDYELNESNDTGETRTYLHPVLQFIKSVMVVLELDHDVDSEVHTLKRSLLSQIGVAEYSDLAKWENPCKTFVLPDIFCLECHESRDINLCYIPPPSADDTTKQVRIWFLSYVFTFLPTDPANFLLLSDSLVL